MESLQYWQTGADVDFSLSVLVLRRPLFAGARAGRGYMAQSIVSHHELERNYSSLCKLVISPLTQAAHRGEWMGRASEPSPMVERKIGFPSHERMWPN
jgi:hypothetical protein